MCAQKAGLRIALAMDLAPRKLGSFEGWLLAFAQETARRGYRLDVYGREPVHPAVRQRLDELRVSWRPAESLEVRPLRAGRAIAQDYDVVHLNFVGARSRLGLAVLAGWPARVLLVDHISGTSDQESGAADFLRRMVRRLLITRVAGIVAVSEYVRNRDIAHFGLRPDQVRTIYNGVDVERYRPGLHAVANGPPFRILSVARLIPAKGVDVLIRAFARLNGAAYLDVVGEGHEAATLQGLARDLGVSDRVRFLGLRDDVAELLREADVFVHPARWAEAFGLAIAEAMASGCTVVGSRVGAVPELIEHEMTGLLVPAGDDDALAGALRRLAADPSLRHRLSECARQRVLERFTLGESVHRHLDWCEELSARI
jgi:glycosyltransferase involved in cell wall biosynthesis